MNLKKEVQHVYLVGAKSLGAYGGYAYNYSIPFGLIFCVKLKSFNSACGIRYFAILSSKSDSNSGVYKIK